MYVEELTNISSIFQIGYYVECSIDYNGIKYGITGNIIEFNYDSIKKEADIVLDNRVVNFLMQSPFFNLFTITINAPPGHFNFIATQ